MARRTTAEAFRGLRGATLALGEAQRGIGGLEPRIAEIREEMRRAEERRQARLLLFEQLSRLSTTVGRQFEAQTQFERGARELGIELPEPDVFGRIRTAITGPPIGREFRGIGGEELLALGRAFEDSPLMGEGLQELLTPRVTPLMGPPRREEMGRLF